MKFNGSSRRAFSLLELLAVIAIIGVLAALGAGAFKSVGGPKPGNVARQLSSILQLASSEARAKSMPVWVGFSQQTVNAKDVELVVVMVTTSDGSDDLTTKLLPIDKPHRFSAIGISDQIPAYPANPRSTSAVQLAAADSDVEFSLPVGGSTLQFDKMILQFTPSGSVSIPPAPPQTIEIGLQPMVGTQVSPSKDTAVVQINGQTGVCRTFQP